MDSEMGSCYSQKNCNPKDFPIIDREFKKVELNLSVDSETVTIRTIHVMSYNLLADRLALPEFFTSTDPSYLSF